MKNPLAGFFEDDAQPLREGAEVKIKVDPYGNPVIEPVMGEVVALSDKGTIKHLKYSTERYHPCGCSAREPAGGRCGEEGCGRTACCRCFARCEACALPLCAAHKQTVVLDAKPTVLCARCLRKLKAKRALRRIAGFFVKQEEPKRS
jgi:hypothetical protein